MKRKENTCIIAVQAIKLMGGIDLKKILALLLALSMLLSASIAFGAGEAQEEKSFADISIGDILEAFSKLETEYLQRLLEYLHTDEASAFLEEMRSALKKTAEMSDAELLLQIDALAKEYNVKLTDSQKEQLVKLCRSLEDLDLEELKAKLESTGAQLLEKAGVILDRLQGVAEKSSGFFEKARDFLEGIGSFVQGLFKR